MAEPKKRPRAASDGTIISDLKAWIRSSGGCCHEAITFDEETRTLKVTQALEADTCVLCIPSKCLVNRQAATSTSSVVSERLYQELLQEQQQQQKQSSSLLHIPADDIVVAWFLATRPTAWQAYINSLPMTAIGDAMPRNWPVDLLESALQGSYLRPRVDEQKKCVQQAYDAIKKKCMGAVRNGDCSASTAADTTTAAAMPDFAAFDQALAVVSSRAFCGKEHANATTLVPLLDLCNHQRSVPKNLRYSWQKDNDGNDENRYHMVVHTTRAVAKGDALCITYGAQSNGQLLLNYGFCVSPNVEPDGSSNDIYEFHVSPSEIVVLRMGHRRYTYGPLVQVLEALGPKNNEAASAVGGDDGFDNVHEPNDMEDFLNECEEEDEHCGDSCMYMGAMSDNEDYGGDFGVEEQKDFDRKALQSFQVRLGSLLQSYPSHTVERQNDLRTKYAQILLDSEQEILRFYQAVAEQLLSNLGDEVKETTANIHLTKARQEQAQSLVDAFLQIRYSAL